MSGLPLDGLRVLVTRERTAGEEFAGELLQLGAVPLVCPAIEIELQNPPGLNEALIGLERFDWLILTSANAIRALEARFEALGMKPDESLGKVSIAVIGDATREALENLGGRAEIVAEPANAESLARQIESIGIDGKLVFFPASRIAQPVLPERLRAAGAGVVQLSVYETVMSSEIEIPEVDQLDVATFTSPSTARNIAAQVSPGWLEHIPAVCIGETTARAAMEAGFSCPMIASRSSLDGIIAALIEFRAQRQREMVDHHGTR